jgi:hypothetical protein
MNMTRQECETIRDLLVDYADGELVAADGQRVAAHLEVCADCRAELRRLERSLEVAQAVWHELAAVEQQLPSPVSGEGQGVRAGGDLATTPTVRPIAGAALVATVGWVERSEPHQNVVESELVESELVGLAPLDPPYDSDGVAVQLPPQRQQRHRRWRFAAAALAAAIVLVLAVLPWLIPHSGAHLAKRSTAAPRPSVAGDSPAPAAMSMEEIQRYIAREAASARLSAAAQLLGTQPGLESQRQRAEQYIIETYGDTAAGRALSARAVPQPIKEPQS